MTINSLIKSLQEIEKKHGNIFVYYNSDYLHKPWRSDVTYLMVKDGELHLTDKIHEYEYDSDVGVGPGLNR